MPEEFLKLVDSHCDELEENNLDSVLDDYYNDCDGIDESLAKDFDEGFEYDEF